MGGTPMPRIQKSAMLKKTFNIKVTASRFLSRNNDIVRYFG